MKKGRKLNVGGVTILAKKLFNMGDYIKLKEEGILDEYMQHVSNKGSLELEGDVTKLWVVGQLILFGTTMVGLIDMRSYLGSNPYVWGLIIAIIAGANAWCSTKIYQEHKKYKETESNLRLSTRRIEQLEEEHHLLVTLKGHTVKLYTSGFNLSNFKDLITYLDAIPVNSANADVYFYRDPNDMHTDYHTNMLMFSTVMPYEYLRYDFQFLGETADYGEESNIEVTTMRVFQIEIDSRDRVTEVFTEKLKYLEVISN